MSERMFMTDSLLATTLSEWEHITTSPKPKHSSAISCDFVPPPFSILTLLGPRRILELPEARFLSSKKTVVLLYQSIDVLERPLTWAPMQDSEARAESLSGTWIKYAQNCSTTRHVFLNDGFTMIYLEIYHDLPGILGHLKLQPSNSRHLCKTQACRVRSASRTSSASTADHAIAPWLQIFRMDQDPQL